ncbi:MAG: hypothetical protein HY360_05875 [Verrucomicrobia bacterium]|nr:hypothetical protein [Verrucomicrobiota bacterium]
MDRVVLVTGDGDYKGLNDGAMLVNVKARKLYAGRGGAEGDWVSGLWVYDIETEGEISCSDEGVLPNSPEPYATAPNVGPTYFFRAVCAMALSADGRKLYLGLCGRKPEPKPLVVYDLDEKGKPVGKARAYEAGDACPDISSLLLDPKLGILYCVAYGAGGIRAVTLRDGEPTDQARVFPFGGGNNYTILPSGKLDELMIGGRPSRVGVISSTADGELMDGKDYNAGDSNTWLSLARVDHCLYFIMDDQLWSWTLDKDWRPVGEAVVHPNIPALKIMTGVHSSVYVVQGDYTQEEDPKARTLIGSRVARYQPDARGRLDKPAFLSETFDHRIMNLTVDESTGVIYGSTWPL